MEGSGWSAESPPVYFVTFHASSFLRGHGLEKLQKKVRGFSAGLGIRSLVYRANRWFFDKTEQIALLLFLKERKERIPNPVNLT